MTLMDITIEGIPYEKLLSIDITEQVNRHGICNLNLIVDSKFKSADLIKFDKQKITVKANKKIIFSGILSDIELNRDINAIYLKMKIITHSILLDIENRTRTFQDEAKKLSAVLTEIAKPYKPADISCYKDDTIAKVIYQYKISDWQFLKEIAERRGHFVLVNSKSDMPKLSVGFKAFNKHKLEETAELLRTSVPIARYKRLEANTYEGARSCYFVENTLRTKNLEIGVGHSVNYENQEQVVIESHIFLLNDTALYNDIILVHAEGCRVDAFDVLNHTDKFYHLTGTVLETKDNNVKVKFDCDEKQDKSKAINIPYESSANNYLYSMPDINDKVYIYLDDIRLAAMGSLRIKEVNDKPENKSFKTKDASAVFTPDKMSLASAETAKLEQDNGVNIIAKKDVTITSKGDMVIQSSQGSTMDNQTQMMVAHMVGYGIYTASLGQPSTVQLSPPSGMIGKVESQIKNAGAPFEKPELSDLAKELDKLTGMKRENKENKNSSGGSGGKLVIDGKKGVLLKVGDSSIDIGSKKLNIKTRMLAQIGYIPGGGGSGSLQSFGAGNPGNRSSKISAEHGSKDRSRVKENVPKTESNKTISR